MATLQKSFRYAGNSSNVSVDSQLHFTIPAFAYRAETVDGKSVIEREETGDDSLAVSKSLSDTVYSITFSNDGLIGTTDESVVHFLMHLAQKGFTNADADILDSLQADIALTITDQNNTPLAYESYETLYSLSTAAGVNHGFTNARSAFSASMATPGARTVNRRQEVIDYTRKNIFLLNGRAFDAAAAQFRAAENKLNDYAFLYIISHVTNLTSGSPKIRINQTEIKTFLKSHFNIDKAERVKAILALIKDDLFDFPVIIPEIKTVDVKGTFKIKTDGAAVSLADFSYYNLNVDYTVNGAAGPKAVSKTYDWHIADAAQIHDNTLPVAFEPLISNSVNGAIRVRVTGFDGSELWLKDFSVNSADLQNIKIEVALVKPVVIQPSGEQGAGTANKKLAGKIVELSGDCKLGNAKIVIQAKQADDAEWRAAGAASADASGNFSLPYPYGIYSAARAIVSLSPANPAAIPIRTDAAHIAINETIADDFLYLLLEGAECKADNDEDDCDCHKGNEANRLPDQQELINSDSYTQDIGGAYINLSTPNRTLNEYSHKAVVRTSDPDVANYILTKDLKGNYRLKGGIAKIDRNPVDLANPVYWQDAPDAHKNLSLYQAVKVSTGHILHYNVVTKADGYSMGELLYSLPLAPGQKKEIVILEQTHNLQGSETQKLTQRESLAASLVNDIDITDTIAGNIGENVNGSSSAATGGVSGGFGLGAIMDSVGISLGVAGGVANASSNASQNSSRSLAEYFHEHMKNSITQNAQSYREMNASVITTVQENQRYGVTSEVIANHNHCHSLTMMYFEVLKHYAIYQELSYVEECLFIPLLMTDFTRENIYKWRDVLAKHLMPVHAETYLQPYAILRGGRQHPLMRGFDAIERINSNYTNVDYPAGAYDEEVINFISGEMYIQTNLPRPKTKYDRIKSWPLEKKSSWSWSGALIGGVLGGPLAAIANGYLNGDGSIKPDAEAIIDDYMSVDANFASVPPAQSIRIKKFDRFIFEESGLDKVQWMAYGGILGFNTEDAVAAWMGVYFKDRLISEWDSIFYNDIAPVIFERIISKISLGNFSAIDFSTDKKYKGGEQLMRVNLRGTGSNKTRKQITDLSILFANNVNLSNELITLNVKNMVVRYSTSHYNGVLFSGFIGDDLYDNVPAIPAPETANEKRNLRKEDALIAQKLIDHLNSNLEYYNKWLWRDLDKDRLYMLLDGFNIETYNDFGVPAGSRSLASVVKNELLGIAGNSLIMAVAPGYKIDRSYIVEQPVEGEPQKIDLLDHYKPSVAVPPYRISIPSKGVFAEAVQGACDACEKVKENTSQDWEKFKPDEPTTINPVTTPVPTVTDWKAAFKDFASPIVNIQNAPAAATPGAGLAGVSELLGKSDIFKDVTGLDQNQKNAMQSYLSNQANAKAFAEMAKEMAMQGHNTEHSDKIADAIRNSPELSKEDKAQLLKDHFGQMVDGGQTKKAEQDAASKNDEPTAMGIASDAESKGKAVKVSTSDESGNSQSLEVGAGEGEKVLAEVIGSIPKLQQDNENACWAFAATIMMSWKNKMTITVDDVLKQADDGGSKFVDIYTSKMPLPSEEKGPFIGGLNMVDETPDDNPSVQIFVDLMRKYGPLWLTTDSDDEEGRFSPHARILVKVTGKEKPDETTTLFEFIDPATGEQTSQPFAEFIKEYNQMVRDNPSPEPFSKIVHFADEISGEGKRSVVLFEHENLTADFDKASGVYKNMPAFIDSSTFESTKDPALQPALENCLDTNTHFKAHKKDLLISLVDLKDPLNPRYAGWQDTKAVYGASAPKICAFYAILQLALDVRAVFRKDIITYLDRKELKKGLIAFWNTSNIPDIFELLEIPAKITDEMQIKLKDYYQKGLLNQHPLDSHGESHNNLNDNHFNFKLITALTFRYIGSVVYQSGLFNPKTKGLWINWRYGSKTPVWESSPFPGVPKASITAVSAAAYYTMMAQEKLSAIEVSTNLRTILQGGCEAYGETFDAMPSGWVANPAVVICLKCGVDGVIHDTVFFDDGVKRGVIIILNKSREHLNAELFKELYNLL